MIQQCHVWKKEATLESLWKLELKTRFTFLQKIFAIHAYNSRRGTSKSSQKEHTYAPPQKSTMQTLLHQNQQLLTLLSTNFQVASSTQDL